MLRGRVENGESDGSGGTGRWPRVEFLKGVMAMAEPSTNGDNGRDARGRFTKGNAGGPGNPNAQHVAKLRDGFRSACSVADVRAICRRLVAMAKKGSVLAAREVLDRAIGKSTTTLEQFDNDDGRVLPVFEILVSNRDEVVEFNQIREMMLMQLRQAGVGPVFTGLSAPTADGNDDSP